MASMYSLILELDTEKETVAAIVGNRSDDVQNCASLGASERRSLL
jgi:hypothetical protein